MIKTFITDDYARLIGRIFMLKVNPLTMPLFPGALEGEGEYHLIVEPGIFGSNFSLRLKQFPDDGSKCPDIIYPPRREKNSIAVSSPVKMILQSRLKHPVSPARLFSLAEKL